MTDIERDTTLSQGQILKFFFEESKKSLKLTSSFDLFANFRRRSLNKVCSCFWINANWLRIRFWILDISAENKVLFNMGMTDEGEADKETVHCVNNSK